MALVECKECGKEISSETRKCPNCGYKKPISWISAFFVAVLIIFGVGILFSLFFFLLMFLGLLSLNLIY